MNRLATTVGRVAALVVASGALLLLPAPSASAHPLGNFTINHYDGLVFSTTDVTNHAVIDTAEIPTLSAQDDVDADGSGEADSAERATYAQTECGQVAEGLELRVGGRAVAWQVG